MDRKKIESAVERYLAGKSWERMELKAMMFDMDGVLFDSMKNHARCWHETMAHFGLDLPEWEAYMHEGR
ncbi:MAG: beta-phosphoglucomutase, partial [Bacteroidaceae bacterium]|nr:beta-phosphoglucomutase [Bacteroidaceae bacterium]